MTTTAATLFLSLFLGASVAACDGDGGGKGNACEQATAVRREAADAYCATRTNLCCYCACWGVTAYYDMEAYLADDDCLCIDPPAAEPPPACEGDLLEDAEGCLENVEACKELAAAGADLACQSTPLIP